MNPGLDYANSLTDPNFFQCQLIVVYCLAYSLWNLVTMNPMLRRLLTFPSQSKLLILILAADLNLFTSPHNCRYQWTLLRWWFDAIACM